jgi:hypothetical protein
MVFVDSLVRVEIDGEGAHALSRNPRDVADLVAFAGIIPGFVNHDELVAAQGVDQSQELRVKAVAEAPALGSVALSNS